MVAGNAFSGFSVILLLLSFCTAIGCVLLLLVLCILLLISTTLCSLLESSFVVTPTNLHQEDLDEVEALEVDNLVSSFIISA